MMVQSSMAKKVMRPSVLSFASAESYVVEAPQWAPYHRITCWTDGEQLERMNLITLMPSGVVGLNG